MELTVAKEGDRETVERLRALSCEEAVILPNSFRSAWLARRAGIRVRWGYLSLLLLRRNDS